PKLTILLHLLLDPSKGLFVFSPVLLAAPFALRKSRAALTGRQFGSLASVPLSILLVYAGYPNWHGGWTVGARYLVPALPFLAFPLLFLPASRVLTAALGMSVLSCTLTTLVFPFVPPDFPAPWGTFALPLLMDGLIAPNAFHWLFRPLAIAVPLLLVAVAGLWSSRPRAYLALGAFASLALSVAIPLSPTVRVERAFIKQVVFERDGAIRQEAGNEFQVSTSLMKRALAQRRLPPPTWPF
ncbi:MAG: hypothetical protein ABI837_21115, partial [Acidobacteriota bacterium]